MSQRIATHAARVMGHSVDKPRATVKYIETQTQKEKDVCN